MSYIGRGIDSIDNISTLDNLSFNGSDATFNLTQNSVAFVPVSADALQIQIDGVIQSGNYTCSGSQVTFDFTPSGSSVCNGIRHFGVGLLTTVSDGAITEAKIGSGAVTSSKIASGVIPTSRPNVNPLIINGNMAVAQRGTSVTGKTSTGIYTVDRMSAVIGSIGTYTVAQESQTSGNAFDNGFANAWRIDCTTADASPSASDQLQMQYTFEGQDLQLFKKGTSNAEKFTLAFWVKSNKTGTGNIQLKDKDNSNRQCTQSYTISSADTWEHKVCVFGADTTGAFDDDNAKSLIINWWLGSGTDSSSGTANHGVWEAQDNTKVNSGGTLNINDNTANDWAITGIQLEVGEYTSSSLPPFQHESYGDNLIRCQRYFEKSFEQGTAPAAGVSAPDGRVFGSWDGQSARTQINFNTTKRASPTVTVYRGSNSGSGTATGTANFIYSGAWNNHGCTSNHADDSQVSLTAVTGNFTTNAAHVADMNFTADAEL